MTLMVTNLCSYVRFEHDPSLPPTKARLGQRLPVAVERKENRQVWYWIGRCET
jgi:hypothetical protein